MYVRLIPCALLSVAHFMGLELHLNDCRGKPTWKGSKSEICGIALWPFIVLMS